jgi:hypothetical protein
MIVNKDFNSGNPTLEKWMTAIRYLHMAKHSEMSGVALTARKDGGKSIPQHSHR